MQVQCQLYFWILDKFAITYLIFYDQWLRDNFGTCLLIALVDKTTVFKAFQAPSEAYQELN